MVDPVFTAAPRAVDCRAPVGKGFFHSLSLLPHRTPCKAQPRLDGWLGPCRRKLAEDEIPPDLWSLGAVIFGLFGATMHSKGAAWVAVVLSAGAFCNKKSYNADWKQIYTGTMFAVSAVALQVMHSYEGIKARAAAGAHPAV